MRRILERGGPRDNWRTPRILLGLLYRECHYRRSYRKGNRKARGRLSSLGGCEGGKLVTGSTDWLVAVTAQPGPPGIPAVHVTAGCCSHLFCETGQLVPIVQDWALDNCYCYTLLLKSLKYFNCSLIPIKLSIRNIHPTDYQSKSPQHHLKNFCSVCFILEKDKW